MQRNICAKMEKPGRAKRRAEGSREKEERFVIVFYQGRARTQSPTNINYASESPTFGVIAEVNPPGVQWTGLALGEPPSGSRYPLHQVSMLATR